MTLSDIPRKTLCDFLLFALALVCSPLLLAGECAITLSSNHIDYGLQPHPSGAVAPLGNHPLDRREIRLNATCRDDSAIELSLNGPLQGNHLKFSDQGLASLRISQAQLDGRPVGLAILGAPGATVAGLESLAVAPGDVIVPVEGGRATRGKILVLSIEIMPQLPLSDMRAREAKVHEGRLRIDVSAS